MRELTYLNLARWESFLLDRKDRISMAGAWRFGLLERLVEFTRWITEYQMRIYL
ncbi:MAG: hypothetical protein LC799_10750 [Actinobacteria bacterium]|nr:hypothetical protein [Actinomycetota bacterium]